MLSMMTFVLGGWLSSSAGIGFTPHVIAIAVGEVCNALSHLYRSFAPNSYMLLQETVLFMLHFPLLPFHAIFF